MLIQLDISNYVLIDQLSLKPGSGLNIITGETGAGKSIMLGALSLLFGERADKNALFDEGKKCIIEGAFQIQTKAVTNFFEENELDLSNEIVIRREITKEKSRAFINDTPVNLNVLRQLAAFLVDINRQHDTLSLNDATFQINIIDTFASHKLSYDTYQIAYTSLKQNQKLLKELEDQERKIKADQDYYQFLLDEFGELDLKDGEIESLESKQKQLANIDEIQKVLESIRFGLEESDQSVISNLNTINQGIQSIKKFDSNIEALALRMTSSIIELKDITAEVASTLDSLSSDPLQLSQINQRLDAIYKLQRKHRAANFAELEKVRIEVEQNVANIDGIGNKIAALSASIEQLKKQCYTLAAQLSAGRAKVIPTFEKELKKLMHLVNMPDAVFKVDSFIPEPGYLDQYGQDKIEFIFSANKGNQPLPLNKVASGGELSRLMLAIKTSVAGNMKMPLMVFDEIDTGISGEAANKVGNLLKQLAIKHQVIAITHLPQIAAKGNHHFHVYKEVSNHKTTSLIKELKEQHRVSEIARMLAGDNFSESALTSAGELLKA